MNPIAQEFVPQYFGMDEQREVGLAYFPMIRNTKRPAVKEWQNCQPGQYTPEELTGNRGINLPRNLMVLDVDPRNYPEGRNSYLELIDRVGIIPPTYTVQTPNVGCHLYLNRPEDWAVSKNLDDFPGLDFLSTGCCVVAAGSVVDGKPYIVRCGQLNNLADAPEALLKLIQKRDRAPQRTLSLVTATDTPDEMNNPVFIQTYAEYLKGCQPAIEGHSGDKTTFDTACIGRDYGLSEVTVLSLMWEHFNPRCHPVWTYSELAKKVHNAFLYAKDAAGNRIAGVKPPLSFLDSTEEGRPKFPIDALPEPIAEAINNLQTITQAPLTLAAQSILSTIALVVQGHVDMLLPTGERKPISQFYIGVGKSGERKTTCDRWAQQAIADWEAGKTGCV